MGNRKINSDHSPTNREKPNLVIQGGMVLTMTDGRPPIERGRVLVREGRIIDIQDCSALNDSPGWDAEVIDAGCGIIMPGLINCHTHAAMTLFRGLADDLPLKQWLFEKIFPAEARFINRETVYWGALLGCLEMISSGTTCLLDGYFYQDEMVRAVQEAGLRAMVAQGVIDFPAPGVADPADNLREGERFMERWSGSSAMIVPGLFCHSPVTCSPKTLKGARDISRSFGLPLQIHLSETMDEVAEVVKTSGKRPVHYLDSLGILDEGLIAAHAIHLDEGEMACLGESGARVVHVPESNMKLASGVCRIRDMIAMGVTAGLGTDGCSSNNNLDMFQEMDTAAKLSKVFDNDPTSMGAKTVLKMATSHGAAVPGFEREIGTLEKGKSADIIVVDLRTPQLCPVYDPFSAIVYSASGADVKDVIVNGKVLLKDRRHTTLDAQEIMGRVRKICGSISI